jgi:tRNA threonylcarbamoyladenosine biosynthesis protein TsaE
VTGEGWTALRHGRWEALAPDAAAMRALGRSLAGALTAGDLIVLDGPLGAGKTTFVQGLAVGLEVQGAVTSPTFVIARRHPGPRVALVHVDAYRIGSAVEVEDLDLEAGMADSVTVVEWGIDKVEGLADSYLVVSIDRPTGAREADAGSGGDPEADPAAGPRQVRLLGIGPRWAGPPLPAQ